jgi:exodeoxyribonuclease V alpha subunit
MNVSHLIQVRNIRSQNPNGRGGCIFSGIPIADDGDALSTDVYVVVRVASSVLGATSVQVGQCWQVVGSAAQTARVVNGYAITECQIEASSVQLTVPSGEHIVTFIANSPDIRGIGYVKARRLWARFGEKLYSLLDQGDVPAIAGVVGESAAMTLVEVWGRVSLSRTLQWLQAAGIDVRVARKIIAFYGGDADQAIQEDPYRLLSFSGKWKQVDEFAQRKCAVLPDDQRRLTAAIEEALYRLLQRGHTMSTSDMVEAELHRMFGGKDDEACATKLVSATIAHGSTNGSFVYGPNGSIHLVGPYAMEWCVARAVSERVMCWQGAQLLDTAVASRALAQYEQAAGKLTLEQREAVFTALSNRFAIIKGGAGVGKTTALKALYALYDIAGVEVFQVALSGRASKRMVEATSRHALTIAGFLRKYDPGSFPATAVVVVDEAEKGQLNTKGPTRSTCARPRGPRPFLAT